MIRKEKRMIRCKFIVTRFTPLIYIYIYIYINLLIKKFCYFSKLPMFMY